MTGLLLHESHQNLALRGILRQFRAPSLVLKYHILYSTVWETQLYEEGGMVRRGVSGIRTRLKKGEQFYSK